MSEISLLKSPESTKPVTKQFHGVVAGNVWDRKYSGAESTEEQAEAELIQLTIVITWEIENDRIVYRESQ